MRSIVTTLGDSCQLSKEEITTSASFSTDTTHHELIVPAGSIYEIRYFSVDNDNSSTIVVKLHTDTPLAFQTIMSESATTSVKAWPQNSALNTDYPIYLSEGYSLRFVWGVAQGTSVEVITVYKEYLV